MSTMGIPRVTDCILMALWRSSLMSRVSLFILAFSASIGGAISGVAGGAIPVPGGFANVVCGSAVVPVTNWSSWAMCWAALGFGGMVVFFPLWREVLEVAMMFLGWRIVVVVGARFPRPLQSLVRGAIGPERWIWRTIDRSGEMGSVDIGDGRWGGRGKRALTVGWVLGCG
jgi:hypothetical protein